LIAKSIANATATIIRIAKPRILNLFILFISGDILHRGRTSSGLQLVLRKALFETQWAPLATKFFSACRPGGGVYRWEFDKGRKSLSVAVNGPLMVDGVEILIRAATDGAGLAWVSEDYVAPKLASGKLLRVLEDWCQPFPGFFLYHPSRRQQTAALAALINTLRF
jgi:DNA-binding transcriptional LysR family regulator